MADNSTYIWVHSDLQLAEPEQARKTLSTAVDDLLDLGQKIDATWCLGDSICGQNEANLAEVAAININQLRRLGAPTYYVLGNHEMDLVRKETWKFPLHEAAMAAPDWHVAELDQFYFTEQFGGFLVVFMGDHASVQDKWWTSHGAARAGVYPYSQKDYENLRQQMQQFDGPVIIASHYAFPGGQRPAAFMERLLPLPENMRLHLHGHAHIGDLIYNKDNPWQRRNPIDGNAISQFNISALESRRSPGSHSALLKLCADNPIQLRIRDHLKKEWVDEYSI